MTILAKIGTAVFSWTEMGEVRRQMDLIDIPRRRRSPHIAIKVSISETLSREEPVMRCVFTTEVKVDIDVSDNEMRAAFIELVSNAARQVYGPAAMLAKKSPTITLAMTSREGKETIPLFESDEVGDLMTSS